MASAQTPLFYGSSIAGMWPLKVLSNKPTMKCCSRRILDVTSVYSTQRHYVFFHYHRLQHPNQSIEHPPIPTGGEGGGGAQPIYMLID